MAPPTSYNEATLAAYMVRSLGSLADTLGINDDSMYEAVNDVTQACGVADVASATNVAQVRALAQCGGAACGADNGGRLVRLRRRWRRLQTQPGARADLDVADGGTEQCCDESDAGYSVQVGTMTADG